MKPYYELRVSGHLDQHWSTWFDDLALSRNADGTTTLRGTIADQAALHGLLAKVRDLGLTLISLNALPTPSAPDSPAHPDVSAASTAAGRAQCANTPTSRLARCSSSDELE